MKRIAAPMVGGMVSSTVLTLVVIPAVHALWKEREVRAAERGQPALSHCVSESAGFSS
jgi:Cu(I)/Ag(I) efflux system membrane protein CusA/SilA